MREGAVERAGRSGGIEPRNLFELASDPALSTTMSIQSPSPVIKASAKDSTGVYRTLATSFRSDEFEFKQLHREKDVAIYQKTKPFYSGFEVVVVRNREAYEIAGKRVEAAEVYPNSNEWGHLGWTMVTETAALRKYKNLLRARK